MGRGVDLVKNNTAAIWVYFLRHTQSGEGNATTTELLSGSCPVSEAQEIEARPAKIPVQEENLSGPEQSPSRGRGSC